MLSDSKKVDPSANISDVWQYIAIKEFLVSNDLSNYFGLEDNAIAWYNC